MTAARIPEALPSVDYLRDCLAYDPESGVLTWLERPENHFSNLRAHRTFMVRWAGKPAGSLTTQGYLIVSLFGSSYLAHRLAWAIHYGAWPTKCVDHINCVKDDNRLCNLRDVESKVNDLGRAKYRTNSSGVTGIAWLQASKKWKVTVGFRGKKYYLGLYRDLEEAIQVREQANKELGFSSAHGQDNRCNRHLSGPGRVRKNCD